MDPQKLIGTDDRLQGFCVYCGGKPETRDHVPPKVFLDEPYPENLVVVEACLECNRGASSDEEYLACFLECVLAGTANVSDIAREKTKRSLRHNPRLQTQIQRSSRKGYGEILWEPDLKRVHNVAVKLARGHVAYELGTTYYDEPVNVQVLPMPLMTEELRREYEAPETWGMDFWPEMGSRAMRKLLGEPPYEKYQGIWNQVQPNQYRYLVMQNPGTFVQIVISEYLAIRVLW